MSWFDGTGVIPTDMYESRRGGGTDWTSLLHRLANEGRGQACWGLLWVAPTRLIPLVYVRAECVLRRIRLECNTHWFQRKTGMETQPTQQLQQPADHGDGLCPALGRRYNHLVWERIRQSFFRDPPS